MCCPAAAAGGSQQARQSDAAIRIEDRLRRFDHQFYTQAACVQIMLVFVLLQQIAQRRNLIPRGHFGQSDGKTTG